MSRLARLRGESGLSLVEVVIGVLVLAVTLLGLAAAGGVAARQVYQGRTDMSRWLAIQIQMESLMARGYGNVSDSSAVVYGYPMTWTVTGTDPQQITLTVQHSNYAGRTVADTLVAYMVDPGA